jgi:hypothetical protein
MLILSRRSKEGRKEAALLLLLLLPVMTQRLLSHPTHRCLLKENKKHKVVVAGEI